MDVDSNAAEFGYELACVLPYAYHLHTTGELRTTTSATKTNDMYYFSQVHHELYPTRQEGHPLNVPNPGINCEHMNYDKWTPPPYKEHFKGFDFGITKPLLIIHNKYNQEWGGSPTNFLDIQILEKIFKLLHNKFQIIYSRPGNSFIVGDRAIVYDLVGESTLCCTYGVLESSKLFVKFQKDFNNFNHFQLCLHANCDHFISVQGGNSYLASYFGGSNIVYAIRGEEVCHNSFGGYFRKFSGCDVCRASTYSEVVALVESKFIEG